MNQSEDFGVCEKKDREYVRCAICGDSPVICLTVCCGFQIVRCRICGLIFVSPRLRVPVVEAGYGEQFDGFNPRHDAKKMRIAKRLVLQIERHEKGGRFLEIGCGTGNFLQAAKERGWEA